MRLNHEVLGQQIQRFAIAGLPAEAAASLTYNLSTIELSEGEEVVLHQPEYSFVDEMNKTLVLNTYSPRIASSLAGLALLESIPLSLIENNVDEEDSNGDGISGRINWLPADASPNLQQGRFGWKAGQASLEEQTARALNLDIGISTSLYPNAYGDCTSEQKSCLERKHGNSVQHDNLEASNELFQILMFYVSKLPAPTNQQANQAGERLFSEAGCVSCHIAQFNMQGQTIKPYTDLLLHDMGEGLADNFNEGSALGNEWRTPPLWGLGSREVAEYLHDGRAKSLQEAILWHAGEANKAVARFKSMTPEQRDDLIRFLNEL